MKHIFLKIGLSLLTLLWLASMGRACLNDRETGYHEREFKSQHQPDVPSFVPEDGIWELVQSHPKTLAALGGLMGLGGLVVRMRARKEK